MTETSQWSGPTGKSVTSRGLEVLERPTRPRIVEVLLTYLTWWLLGPIVLIGPDLAYFSWVSDDARGALVGFGAAVVIVWVFFGAFILCWACNRLRRLPR